MIYLARVVYLIGVAAMLACIGLLAVTIGRRGVPLIDSPFLQMMGVVVGLFGAGLIGVAQVMGNDLAKNLPSRHHR